MDNEHQGSSKLNVLGIPGGPAFRPSRVPTKPRSPGDFLRNPSYNIPTRPSNATSISNPSSVRPNTSSPRRQPSTDKSKAKFRWMKGELIGSGSHGKVYMGFNATTGEVMAVKQVELPQTRSDRMRNDLKVIVAALKDERETLEELDHDNIVQYLGFEENPETLNIFLQYVSGGTINKSLRTYGKFREDVTIFFTSQILQGLSYLHAQGIIHRDLKSDNILVEESGVCKISDFGISKKLQELDRAYSKMKGTSFWMAPEALFGGESSDGLQEGYTTKVDIWSVGCIVIEMWTGHRPWYNQALFPVLMQLSNDKAAPPLPEGMQISDTAESFRAECFHPDPVKRSSASYLLNHAYLTLPPGWSFPGMQDMGQKGPPKSDIEEPSDVLSQGLTLPTDPKDRPPSPAMTMSSEVRFADYSRQSRMEVNSPPKGPPTVFIEPPRPRIPPQADDWTIQVKRYSSSSSTPPSGSPASHRSSQSLSRGGRRPLIVYNPDEDKNARRQAPQRESRESLPPAYVYEPPPLPGFPGNGGPSQYSNRLATFAPIRSTPPPPPPPSLSSPPRFNPTYISGNPLTPPSSQGREDLYDTYSETETDYSGHSNRTGGTWKRPPRKYSGEDPSSPDRHRRTLSQPRNDVTMTSSSNSQWHVGQPSKRTSNLGDTRPAVKEVLEHLENFFPSHNLDAVVESPLEGDNERHHGTQAPMRLMKSVKTIAEEQISSPIRRRQTRLWDIQPEEIKARR